MQKSLTQKTAFGLLLFLAAFALRPSLGLAATTTSYLRPNVDITSQWTAVGAAKAWEALDDEVTEQETPGSSDYIYGKNKLLFATTTEVGLTSVSLSGKTVVSADAYFYMSNVGGVTLAVVSGSGTLAAQTFVTAGWHKVAVPLSNNQSLLDNASIVLSTASTEIQTVHAAFVKLVSQPSGAGNLAYLRPNGDVTSVWTVNGAAKAWEALDDNVTEQATPSNGDYISGSKALNFAASSELQLTTTSLTKQTILSASAWFYTPTSGPVTAKVKSGSTTLATQTFAGSGWHILPVSLDGTQSQLDNAAINLSTESSETQIVYAAFLRLLLRPPPTQIYWGSWMSGEAFSPPTGTAPWDAATWSNFETDTGKAVSIVHFGQPPPWRERPQTEIFETKPFSLARQGGSIPLVDMSNGPDLLEKDQETGKSKEINVTLSDIVEGLPAAIQPLEKWFAGAAEYNYPLFFRWDWEMNGDWFQWGDEAAEKPERFVKAWRRLHELADGAGATNITWVWCPNASFSGSTPLSKLYPGDPYVDWTCIDGYNRGTNPLAPDKWVSFHDRFIATYKELLAIAPWKPIMVGETASTEYGGSKADWISQALKGLPDEFPNIRALVWFNWYIEDGVKEERWDWPIESSSSAITAFSSGIASSYFAKDSFGELPQLQRIEPLP